ncbi:MAG: transposase [Sphaerochaeta sp.]|nr:transposase [Sphaerochaeta sp.]
MEQKHERPEFITNFKKPQATEIKHINGHWYLYERKTKYDPSTQKSRKVSGRLLGTITESGLVPRQAKVTDAFDLEVREFGAFQYFYEHTRTMREKLMEYFPGSWKQIYTVAILRTVYGCRFKRLEAHYQDSFASLAYPSLALSSSSLTLLLRNLGRNREAIRLFMGSIRGDKGRYILVDGHRILSSSKTVDHAQLGYDSKMRYKPQLNLIYLFSLGDDCAFPEYYKQYGGSITDGSAFSDILSEAGIDEQGVTFVGDKGFMSQANCSLLDDCGLHYIIPLKRGNAYVQGKVPQQPLYYSFSFTYHGRSIFASTFAFEDCTVHLYRDTVLFDSEMGTLSIKTNRKELNAHQVYAIYKQRQAIEQYFKTYWDTMSYDDSCLGSNEPFEGWLFLNHL